MTSKSGIALSAPGQLQSGLGLRNNRSRTTDLTYIARYDPLIVDFCHFSYKISVYSSDGTGTPTAASLLKSGVSDTPTHRLNWNCREELDVIPELNNYHASFQHRGERYGKRVTAAIGAAAAVAFDVGVRLTQRSLRQHPSRD